MDWHIETDIIALLVALALYIYTLRATARSQPSLRNRRFMRSLLTGMAVTLIDIVASIVMETPGVSPLVYHLFMTLYYLTIELVIVSWCYYAAAIVCQDDARRRVLADWIISVPYMIYALLALSNPLTGLFFKLDAATGAYSRGPMFMGMIALYFAYSLALLVWVFVRRARIPKNYPWPVLMMIPVIVGGAIPLQLANPGWLVILPGYMVCLVLAFLFLQTERVRGERELLTQMSEMVDHFSSGLVVWRIGTNGKVTLESVTSGFALICEEERDALAGHFAADPLYGVHPDDRELAAIRCDPVTLRDREIDYRYITSAGRHKWFSRHTKFIRQRDGVVLGYSTVTDITEQKKLERQLADVIDTVPCGICLNRWDGDTLHPLLVNAQFSEMLGQDALSKLKTVSRLDYELVHPEDIAGLRAASLEALTHTHTIDYTFRVFNPQKGQYVWLRERGTLKPQQDGTRLVYIAYNDVTQEHQTEQRLRESEQALEYATAQAGLWYWRYDAYTDRLYPDRRYREDCGLPEVLDNFLTDWLPKGSVHRDDQRVFRDACLRIKAGEEQVVFEAQNDAGDGSSHWSRFCLTNLFDADGNATISVGTATRIDTERELRTQYELEHNRPSLGEENLLVHALFNLNRQETLEYAYRDGGDVPADDRTAFTYGDQNLDRLLLDKSERDALRAMYDRDRLLECFAKGQTELRMDYRRYLPNGEVAWIRNLLRLMRDPATGDMLLFAYFYNVDDEKLRQLMYHSLASDNYDYVVRIDGLTKRYALYPKSGLTYRLPPLQGDDADAVTRTLHNEGVVEEDREATIHNHLVDNIIKHLDEQGRYQFVYREVQQDGSVAHKRVTQYYLDKERKIILMTREDVTEVVRTESERNDMLASALEAANQASRAKSQFLSRVSHELRTPLNAIIGFMELAKNADAERSAVYLANSDIAARQLLSIINDVLDMSSIESGKLKLASAPFDLRGMLHALTNVYLSQCHHKGLEFDVKLGTPMDEWLMGDKLRVNQILMNLLGNAVKFTTEGRVQLLVSQRDGQNGRVLVRFEVSDTGCGISSELRGRLFNPFEQESASTAQRYGGNGLGLSIVHSLVDMMGGVIRVESQLGLGSTFIVDLPFERCETIGAPAVAGGVESLRVLVVDDVQSDRDYMSAVLDRLGARHMCVADGDEALRALAEGLEAGDPYGVCLVDWKMPRMSGMETTKRIRERYGSDVVVIVISAYEHHQADASAKAAGADMFVTKPLFQSSLNDLFMTLTGGRAMKARPAAAPRDFGGRTVLLAEDNAMNRMVAEGLLDSFGLKCESVVNGREAVERFTASAPGQYAAILMDIQMPLMDGYEATERIRHSEHPDARDIPILALTANAFNEDVARSLSGGMNAHIAKPIEPEQLASELARAFREREAGRG